MVGASDDTSLLRMTLEAIPGFVVTIDKNGTILFVNRMQVGFEHVQIVGTSIFDHIRADQLAVLRRSIDAVFSTGELQSYEIISTSGTWYESRIVPVRQAGGEVTRAVICARDATQIHAATEAARKSDERARAMEESFRAIIEHTPDCLFLHRAGVIVYANPACVTALGYDSASDLVGHQVVEFMHPDDQARALEGMRRMVETGTTAPKGPGKVTQYRLLRRDDEVLTFEIAPVQRIQFEGHLADLVVGRDISVRKEMEQRLLLSERLASMGSLAACIGNEINNPLTYVVGNLSYIAQTLSGMAETDQTGKCRQLERAVADVREGVDRVRSVVADLNTLSQPEHDIRTVIDVRRILESTINVAKNEVRHRARLERDYSETPLVYANEALLGQVFLNLLLNAARAIPEGSASRNTIRVSTRRDASGRAVIEFRDTGSRLTQSYASIIFEDTPPFMTRDSADREPAGTVDPDRRGMSVGLGLPICRTIVTGLGGEIAAESAGQSGAVFRVWLPPAKEVIESGKEAAEVASTTWELPIPRSRILVVDDEPVIAATMKRALEGHDVYIVTSGRDALELCRGESFDLVLCDLMMPDLTGMDLYDELSRDSAGKEQRIIFMTAGAFTPRAWRFLGSVPNLRLKKPFDPLEIQSVVKKYFQRRSARL